MAGFLLMPSPSVGLREASQDSFTWPVMKIGVSATLVIALASRAAVMAS